VNVFVLSTGRCGSTTVARAFGHATNFTAGHETRAGLVRGRLEYPPDHIESDNRLTWFLAALDQRYDESSVHWVHLTRRLEDVVESYWHRWEDVIERHRSTNLVRDWRQGSAVAREWRQDPTSIFRGSIAVAFAYGVIRSDHPLTPDERRAACDLYTRTVDTTIRAFLEARSNVSRIELSNLTEDFTAAWARIGAEGALDEAITELELRHNRRQG
jgi:hypothetical protein